MARIVILVFIVAVNAVLSSQPDEIYEYGTKIDPSHNYYPNDTLNLVTLGVVNGKKYFFASEQQAWATWYQASYFCNAHGMDLASIETQHEIDLIMEHIAKIDYGPETYWISGHKNGRSSWLWINGDYIIISGPQYSSDPARDHCLSIARGELEGRRCETQTGSGFICEERETLEESLNERSIYPSDTLNLVTLDSTTGTQYFFATANASWFDASYFCNSYGMDLVTIDTQEENDLIMAHIESLGWKQAEHYWTSAHKIGRSTWLWINGESIIYDDWANGQPDSLETYRCMFLSGGDWYNYECEQSIMKAFICESRETPKNSTVKATYYPADMMNLVTLGPGVGKNYLVTDQNATWYDANYFCNAHGMDLVSIETQEENNAIMDHLASIGHSSSYTWTSGHKIGRTTYLWINGEYIQFADWARGEPSEPKTQSCLRLTANDWYDYGCYSYRYFICEERKPQYIYTVKSKGYIGYELNRQNSWA